MNAPDTMQEGTQAQILLKLGAMGEDIAVIKDRLSAVGDHEQRIRQLEHDAAQSQGSKDLVSRIWATLATAAAVGSAVVAYLHK